jgi:HlyD family secretion protein
VKQALFAVPLLVLACCQRPVSEVRAPGLVQAVVVSVRAAGAGPLATVSKREGDPVRAGEEIARIVGDRLDLGRQELELAGRELALSRANLRDRRQAAQATLDIVEKQVNRLEILTRDEAVPGEQLERERVRLQEARTALRELAKGEASLEIEQDRLAIKRRSMEFLARDLRLTSPIDGRIVMLYVAAGESVVPGAPIADIYDEKSLFIDVYLQEVELARLKVGDPVRIAIDGLDDRTFSGTIRFFGQQAELSPRFVISETERRTLLYRVKIAIDAPGPAFKIGMPVTVTFAPR